MLKSAIFILVAGFVLYEIVEHVVFPLIWSIKDRRKRSVCGASGMLGEVGKVKYWKKFDGQVFVHGELWRAVSEFPLSEGDPVVVQKVNGLTVTVAPVDKADMSQTDRISKKTAL